MPGDKPPKRKARRGRKGRKTRSSRNSEVVDSATVPLTASTIRFLDLPIEIRFLIWDLTLPASRLLKVMRKPEPQQAEPSKPKKNTSNKRKDAQLEEKYEITRASYGGMHPSILSVNRESRSLALQHFTKIFGAYFNFDRDVLFFEVDGPREEEARLMNQILRESLLDKVKHIAMAADLWNWAGDSVSGMALEGHGLSTCRLINTLRNIETCTVTYTDHTRQEDIVTPGRPWRLGPLNGKVSLDPFWREHSRCARDLVNERAARPYGKLIKLRQGVELSLQGVHGRRRACLPHVRRTLIPTMIPEGFSGRLYREWGD